MKVVQPILLTACFVTMLLATHDGWVLGQGPVSGLTSRDTGTSPALGNVGIPPLNLAVTNGNDVPGIKRIGTPVQLTRVPDAESSPIKALSTSASNLPYQLLAEANANDATLNSVAIVSPDELCAVGNCGTILLTRDAGRSWEIVDTPTSAHLYEVIFFDAENGLAVGGSVGSYSGTSRAVILRTADGGKSWQRIANDLPRLRGMRRMGGQTISWGDYDPQRKTGTFVSLDRGSSWKSAGIQLGHVTAAAQNSSAEILAFDRQAQFAMSGNRQPQRIQASGNSSSLNFATRRVRSLQFTGQRWVRCGDGGLLESSLDGRSWQDVVLPLDPRAATHCDWQSIFQSGQNLGVCGNPGSLILHSEDGGASWTVVRTGQSLPISKLCFVDRQRGWAVGPLGRILATRDGGATWYLQRGRNRKTGVLSITKDFEKIPWAPLASAAWESQVTCVSVVASEYRQFDANEFLPGRIEQLVDISRGLGVELVHRRMRTPQNNPKAALADLAVLIATWNPSLVLVDSSLAVASQTLVENASQENFAALLEELGLQPARFQKLVTTCSDDTSQYTEHSQRVLKEIGLAGWDLLSRLPPQVLDRSEAASMRTLWTRSKNGAANASLLGAVALEAGIERNLKLSKLGNYQMVMGRVHRKRSLQALVERQGDLTSWRNDFEFILQNLPSQEVAPSLWQLAHELHGAKHADRRKYVLHRLSVQNLQPDAAVWAMIELLKMLASDELKAWHSSHSEKEVLQSDLAKSRNTPGVVSAEHLSQMPWNASPFTTQAQSTAVVTAAASDPLPQAEISKSAADARTWFQFYGNCCQEEPRLLHRPDLQLMAFRMSRLQSGMATVDQNRLEDLLTAGQLPGWRELALQERDIWQPGSIRSPESILASSAPQRPILDGRFNESFWSRSTVCRLTPAPGTNLSADLRFAFDTKYLYVSATCPIEKSASLPALRERRSYDCDLSRLDHLRLRIDTDRDYSSCTELAVAVDGSTYDDCCGAKQFNPKWHVLVKQQEDAWVAEFAIELGYLTLREDLEGARWAISVQRIVGEQPIAAWARASSFSKNPKAGILKFEDPASD